MKLTWFAGSTFRIQIGGAILVVDPDGAPDGVNAVELVSGADRVVGIADAGLPEIDLSGWTPRRPAALIDVAVPALELHRSGAVLIAEIPGESPLVLASKTPNAAGRWVRDAVVVCAGTDAVSVASGVLDAWGPKLVALALPETELDAAFAALSGRVGQTGLVALEPGLALEV